MPRDPVAAARQPRGPAPRERVAEVGYFGKLPSLGDFVSIRFDRALRGTLDDWLQRTIALQSRQMGGRWPEAFAAMPAWRFALDAGIAGREAVMGVMVPSQDRVGRAFPLIAAARLLAYAGPARPLCDLGSWYGRAEGLLAGARRGAIGLGALDAGLDALGEGLEGEPLLDGPSRPGTGGDSRSYWWTAPGEGTQPRRFSAAGLPAPEAFDRLLEAPAGLEAVAPAPPPVQASRPAPPGVPAHLPQAARPPGPAGLRAILASHAGTRLRLNADAATDGTRSDLHALAHGLTHAQTLGGSDDVGAVRAARLVLDRLAAAAPSGSLDGLVAHVKGALGSANTLLRTDPAPLPPGAVLVALLAAEGRTAVVWAGDLRAYLLREGLMRPLTRDHVEVGLRRTLARSIGGPARFGLEVAMGDFRPGDRFLLATAPLARVLPERAIAARLAMPDAEAVAAALVEDALVAGVPDNVSALVAVPA